MPALASGVTSGTEQTFAREVVKTGPLVQNTPAPASYNTAGNVTYLASDIIGTIIVRNCNGAGRTDVLPSAAAMRSAIPQCKIGDTVDCLIINGSSGAFSITMTAGSGGTLDPNQNSASAVISQNTSKYISIRMTNVTPGSEAYTFYC